MSNFAAIVSAAAFLVFADGIAAAVAPMIAREAPESGASKGAERPGAGVGAKVCRASFEDVEANR